MKNDFIQELYNLYSSKKMKNFFEFAQGEKRALLEFKLAKGDISPSDLCQKLSVSKQRITSILNSLYERRKTNIKLTPNGKKYIDKLIAYVLTDLNKIINKISSKDIDKLTEIMANINKILNE